MHLCFRFNTKDISFCDICVLEEVRTVLLTKLLILQL